MKMLKLALLAALVPAAALADPDRPPPDPGNGPVTETDTFESASGHARLGVMVMSLTPELRSYFGAPKDAGLLVARVDPNSPAARAGIKPGDVITKLDDDAVRTAGDLIGGLTTSEQGKRKVAIEVIRNHGSVDLQASIGTPPPSQAPADDDTQKNL